MWNFQMAQKFHYSIFIFLQQTIDKYILKILKYMSKLQSHSRIITFFHYSVFSLDGGYHNVNFESTLNSGWNHWFSIQIENA